jgi:hypothetical protein
LLAGATERAFSPSSVEGKSPIWILYVVMAVFMLSPTKSLATEIREFSRLLVRLVITSVARMLRIPMTTMISSRVNPPSRSRPGRERPRTGRGPPSAGASETGDKQVRE